MSCLFSGRFLLFTDYFIYWIHRILHHPIFYKTLHKHHHKWIGESRIFPTSLQPLTFTSFLVPTPFASHAFNPIDGYLQSVPYHVFIFIFPLHRKLFLGLFIFVNFWTILVSPSHADELCTILMLMVRSQIHDSDMITGHPLERIINGPAHHTLHHLYFTVNYGQVRLYH